MRKLLLLAAAGVLACFSTGCASYKTGPVSLRDVSEFGNAKTAAGISVAAELLQEEGEVKRSFYLNLPEKDYYPVQLVTRNGSDNRILLLKENIQIEDSSGNVYRPINVAAMIDEFERNKMAYALLGFGIFSYMSADEANKKMASDWTTKELPREVIIAPSRNNSGYLYFKFPRGVKPTGMSLITKVENLETKAVETFQLQL
jgi:hypothetical protein